MTSSLINIQTIINNANLSVYISRLDLLPSNNLRDKCIYSAERRERGARDYERSSAAAREHVAVFLEGIHHTCRTEFNDTAESVHLAAADQPDVGDIADVLSSLAALSLHLAQRSVTGQRGLPRRLQIQLLCNGDLVHLRDDSRSAGICRSGFLLRQAQSHSRHAPHLHPIAGVYRAGNQQQKHRDLRLWHRTIYKRGDDHRWELRFL